ncbi:uncharacterized protein LOC123321000 [Coccinella septempunctata]|uniref:uncharacterized protein LOC123321000 n=1 Tax=Coccinella septempunctata TaxID=41139 RepID=UPI001D0847D6|nr:uncharacterized protein LOC123321000 [Coccinella septempunctata]
MRIVFNALRCILNEKEEKLWFQALPKVEDDLNNTVNKSTGYAPVVLMKNANKRLTATMNLLSDIVVKPIEVNKGALREKLNVATNHTKKKFDETRKASYPFEVNQKVVMEVTQLSNGGKLKPKFIGPFEIKAVLPNDRYVLKRIGGQNRTTTAGQEQLRIWPEDPCEL